MKVPSCSLLLFSLVAPAAFSAQFTQFDGFGAASGDAYGHALAFLGDLNGDGFGEWAASSPSADVSGMSYAGEVSIYSGRTGQVLRTHNSDRADAVFGSAVVDHGDVNGDGVSDYAIGAATHTETLDRQGKVIVYSGSDGAEIRSFLGGFATSRFGQVLDAGGDLDGDGVRDLLVSAYSAATTQHRAGRVNVFSGATGSRIFVVNGESFDELRGTSACIVEDLDGDGFDDVVTGAHFASVPFLRVHSGATTAVLRTIWPVANVDHRLGSYLEGMGDVDGDGAGDFLVATQAARILSATGAISYRVGRVSVHSGATGAVLTEVYGRGELDDFGQAACSVPDYDGDGVRDFAALAGYMYITTPGPFSVRLSIYSGTTGELLLEQPLLAETQLVNGTSLAAGADVTGDGIPDFLFGNQLWPTTTNVAAARCSSAARSPSGMQPPAEPPSRTQPRSSSSKAATSRRTIGSRSTPVPCLRARSATSLRRARRSWARTSVASCRCASGALPRSAATRTLCFKPGQESTSSSSST